jgi:ComF family protein
MIYRSLFQSIANLFLTPACPLCQRTSPQLICRDCERRLKACQFPATEQSPDPYPVLAWGRYGGDLKRAIAQLKYEGHPQLARPLGTWLAEHWQRSPQATNCPKHLAVVPIPLHTAKQKQRGYNQAELLAQAFCDYTRLPLIAQGLVRQRETQAQFGLSAAQRQANLQQAFHLGTPLQKRRSPTSVLLLDDIYTTGATIQSAIAACQNQGISVHGVVVLSRAIAHSPPPLKPQSNKNLTPANFEF